MKIHIIIDNCGSNILLNTWEYFSVHTLSLDSFINKKVPILFESVRNKISTTSTLLNDLIVILQIPLLIFIFITKSLTHSQENKDILIILAYFCMKLRILNEYQ